MIRHRGGAARLERCLACGGLASPRCLLCDRPTIVRLGGATKCFDCNQETVCPCAAGLTLNDSTDNDATPVTA